MIVLDTPIVNVALPSIRSDLGFSQTSLAWVVNAYLLTLRRLLLGGRLGDLFGHRRLFLAGIASAVSLSLTMNLFAEPAERAKAMGVFGFVAAGGGSIGVLLGGVQPLPARDCCVRAAGHSTRRLLRAHQRSLGGRLRGRLGGCRRCVV